VELLIVTILDSISTPAHFEHI